LKSFERTALRRRSFLCTYSFVRRRLLGEVA
jgi:hypothetical protein